MVIWIEEDMSWDEEDLSCNVIQSGFCLLDSGILCNVITADSYVWISAVGDLHCDGVNWLIFIVCVFDNF